MNLFDAVNGVTNEASTNNGGLTNASSLDANLDFFFAAGSSRGKDIYISGLFFKALSANEDVALRTLLWLRDVRGGAGERQTFRDLSKLILCRGVFEKTPEVGRWDDLLVHVGTAAEDCAFEIIKKALAEGNGLCAKWMPRKGDIANKLRKFLGLTPKQYRKLLVGLSSTVEQKMCAKQWDEIEFGKVPSVAAARYQKAFSRNAQEAYEAYKEALTKGEEKINAGAVYPYDVLKSVTQGDPAVAQAQWNALPNYLEGSTERFLPVVDVSGSMQCPVPNTTLTCMDVAVSLGLYISERNEGVFKDVMMTFHDTPQMFKISGSLEERNRATRRMPWGGSTNLEVVFSTLLRAAVEHKVPESEMPTSIIIVSDMEFNSAFRDGHRVSSYDNAKIQYESAGYKLPKIVFWTVNAREGNVPVKSTDEGTALVSGFSPAILKSILKGGMNPVQIMLDTVMQDRYNINS